MNNQKPERLGSLDVLRGFDLFCLVCFQPVLVTFARALDKPWMNAIAKQFMHVEWEGYAFWDIIMPLFLFMAGASMPFAFAKHLKYGTKAKLYKRILKRVLFLWILGMICQGNLLAFDPQHIYFYSNTLQAIAIGYLIAAILMLHLKNRGQVIVTSSLLIIYWALMSFVRIDGFGGGDFSRDNNLAEYIDRLVLGRFRDGVRVTPEGLDFGWYRYTWILSSLNFGVTVMTGVFAGKIMKSSLTKKKKMLSMLSGGIAMVIAGKLWALHMPIIKTIWTSSMTLFSSGICFLLMTLFYYLIDYKDYGRYLNWLKIYGMNSIAAYMIYSVIDFSSVVNSLFFGTKQFIGDYYNTLITIGNVTIVFFILSILYRRKIYLKV